MQPSYWQKQSGGKPLFPDLLWSRPENRTFAGKLLIIGGNAYGFAAPAEAFSEAQAAGVGIARVLLPDAVQKVVGHVLETADFAPSTPSGSFSQKALNDCLAAAAWGDGVLLAGDLGRNSETAILLEKLAEKYQGQLTMTKDAVDYMTATPQAVLSRPDTTLILGFAQLQKIATQSRHTTPFTFDMAILRLVEALHEFSATYPAHLIVKHLQNIFVASGGTVSSTKLSEDMEFWRVKTAAHAAVWWLQNPSKPFEALTTAVQEASSGHS